jgi:hypothetical protein
MGSVLWEDYMSNAHKPDHRLIVWTNNDPLANALVSRGHTVFLVYKNTDTDRNDWWFDGSHEVLNDISKYATNKLEVNAQRHYRILKGEDEEMQYLSDIAEVFNGD